jgi:SLT domain-containing protein
MGKIFGKLSNVMGLNNDSGPSGEQGGAGGGVERWRSTVLTALNLVGQSSDNVDAVLNQIRTESSGNPQAINLTDSNARAGHPSKGLVQTIDSTFQAYRLPQLANDIYNPLSNIVAGIRYAIATYGSIKAGMRGVAYDDGGWLMPNSKPVNMLRKPEPVLTPQQWRVAEQAIAEVADRNRAGSYTWNVVQQPGQSPAQLAREMNRLMMFQAGRSV